MFQFEKKKQSLYIHTEHHGVDRKKKSYRKQKLSYDNLNIKKKKKNPHLSILTANWGGEHG